MNEKTTKTALTSLALVAALAAPAARAASVTIDLSWTDYYFADHTANFKVYLAPVSGSPGAYTAASISGTFRGQAITGLTSQFLAPDQLIFAPDTGLTTVDDNGLGFGFSGGAAVFYFSDYYNDYVVQDSVTTYYPAYANPTIAFSATPEPSGWALMLLGVGGLGGALRIARKRGTALAAA